MATASVARAQEPQAAGQAVHGNANRGARIRAENERPGTTSWQSEELRRVAEERRQDGPHRRDPHDERSGGPQRGAPNDSAPQAPAPLMPPPFGSEVQSSAPARPDSGGVPAQKNGAGWTNSPIRGYADATSINKGESLNLRIGTTRPSYRLEVYRMGWYNGTGGRLMHSVASLTGQNQAVPTPQAGTGSIVANWQVSYTLQTAADWVSGMYLVKLISSAGEVNYIPFVLRDDGDAADILYQVPFTTYQAYNN